MVSKRRIIPVDSLLQLRQRLDRLPCKSPERVTQVSAVATLYGISISTVYRALHCLQKPHATHRADYGKPRLLPKNELERYCELIAETLIRRIVLTQIRDYFRHHKNKGGGLCGLKSWSISS